QCASNETCNSGSCQKSASSSCNSSGKPFGGGSGTAIDPYLICSAAQLLRVDDKSSYVDDHYKLAANLNLGQYGTFEVLTPNKSEKFTGVLEGNGYVINGLTLNKPATNNVGLFGYTENAKFRNIVLRNVSITGKNQVGALAGNMGGNGKGRVKNAEVTGTVSGEESVGALVGLNWGKISGAEATGSSSKVDGTDLV
ncbi:MAG: hypothetical protein ABEN55_09190, partial [Bradymonadaceae bacterium]